MSSCRFRKFVHALLAFSAAALMLVAPDGARAQKAGSVTLDPRGGIVFPVADLNDITDFGVSAGAGIAYRITPHLAIRGDFDYSRLDGEADADDQPLAPSLELIQYTAGLEVNFARPRWQEVPFSFRMNLGFGGTSMSGSETYPNGSSVTFEQTYPTVITGGKIGIPLSGNVRAFVASGVSLIFADEEETGALTTRAPGAEAFDTAWTFPLTLGIQAVLR